MIVGDIFNNLRDLSNLVVLRYPCSFCVKDAKHLVSLLDMVISVSANHFTYEVTDLCLT